jgi:hypothetical protein
MYVAGLQKSEEAEQGCGVPADLVDAFKAVLTDTQLDGAFQVGWFSCFINCLGACMLRAYKKVRKPSRAVGYRGGVDAFKAVLTDSQLDGAFKVGGVWGTVANWLVVWEEQAACAG